MIINCWTWGQHRGPLTLQMLLIYNVQEHQPRTFSLHILSSWGCWRGITLVKLEQKYSCAQLQSNSFLKICTGNEHQAWIIIIFVNVIGLAPFCYVKSSHRFDILWEMRNFSVFKEPTKTCHVEIFELQWQVPQKSDFCRNLGIEKKA